MQLEPKVPKTERMTQVLRTSPVHLPMQAQVPKVVHRDAPEVPAPHAVDAESRELAPGAVERDAQHLNVVVAALTTEAKAAVHP